MAKEIGAKPGSKATPVPCNVVISSTKNPTYQEQQNGGKGKKKGGSKC